MPGSTDLLLAAAFLLLLLALALWALRRASGRARWWRMEPRRLQLVEARALGPRHRVVLMRVDDKEILIGVSPTQISMLDRWVASPQTEPLVAATAPSMTERP